jgi:hypothetical protein
MEQIRRNAITTTIGNALSFTIFVLAAFGIYTSLFHGSAPFVEWSTDHNLLFGLAWVFFVFPGVLLQIKIVNNCFNAVANWSHGWSMLPLVLVNLFFQLCGLLLLAMAWFPSQLPPPFSNYRGGILTGLITLVIVVVILAIFNVTLIRYMKWLFRYQHAKYIEMTG